MHRIMRCTQEEKELRCSKFPKVDSSHKKKKKKLRWIACSLSQEAFNGEINLIS